MAENGRNDNVNPENDYVNPEDDPGIWEQLQRLTRDLKDASKLMGRQEARYSVDTYYAIQRFRTRAGGQKRASEADGEPNRFIQWMFKGMKTLEDGAKNALGAFASAYRTGQWMQSICGIGPVISAGFLAHFDIRRAKYAGNFWSFAGLSPSVEWLSRTDSTKLIKQCMELLPPKDEFDARLTRPMLTKLARRPEDAEKLDWSAEEFGEGILDVLESETESKPEAQTDQTRLEDALIMACVKTGRKSDTVVEMAKTSQDGRQRKLTMENVSKALSRRPWNAKLKTLCWKLGESFVKVHNNDKDFYGKIYAKRKKLEAYENATGKCVEAAREKLATCDLGKNTAAYKWYAGCLSPDAHREIMSLESTKREAATLKLAGEPGSYTQMLPPDHIHSRAKRYAVKIFVSHLHEVMHWDYYGIAPPDPYIFGKDGHGDRDTSKVEVPNFNPQGFTDGEGKPFNGKPLRDLLEG